MRVLRKFAAGFIPRALRPLARAVEQFPSMTRGMFRGQKPQTFPAFLTNTTSAGSSDKGDLEGFFRAHAMGRGIHKWIHLFPIYERHLGKFRSARVNLLEIGVQSGGSLDMWRHYFGEDCRIFGVDIDERCKSLASEAVTIFIGDQADRAFWREVKSKLPPLDIVIDDGGHTPHQQIVSVEELLPHLREGGVYLCEDIYGNPNRFAMYINGLASGIHEAAWIEDSGIEGATHVTTPNDFQKTVSSVHVYPYVIVLERNSSAVHQFAAVRMGSEWLKIGSH
jgi:hypothetical protein